jgi:glycosyltransferase involved in cell wall biosynthesis
LKKKLRVAFQLSRNTGASYAHCAKLLEDQQPEHTMMLLCDGQPKNRPSNFLPLHHLRPSLSNEIMRRYWYTIQLPKWLERNQIDFFFGCDYRSTISNTAKTIITLAPPLNCSLQKLQKHCQQAYRVLIANPLLASEIRSTLPEMAEKIVEIPYGIENMLEPVDHEKKSALLDKLTDGHEFFLCMAENQSNESLLVLLKAFSLFKKWQHSHMKLILVLDEAPNKTFLQKLHNYKYRNDLILLQHKDISHDLLSSAYACLAAGVAVKSTEALLLRTGLPLILPTDKFAAADYGDAVVFAEWNEQAISKQMILLYKDEAYRSEIIEKLRRLLQERSWANVSEKIWQEVLLPALA